MAKDAALSFVGQIMTAYKAVMKAEGSALEHAIECGKYLALAKENVEAARPKRKWSAWLEEHCPDIHRNTAALYMRLAENEDKIAECTSIRQADMLLRALNSSSSDSESNSEESADEADDDVAQRVVQQADASPDLKSLLENSDVDEIGIALRDADKLDEFTTAAIVKLTPDKVCDALTKAWSAQQLRDLANRVTAHLGTLTGAPRPSQSDLNIPPALRRPPPTQPTL